MKGIRFHETMSGELLSAAGGATEPFEFTVDAEGPYLLRWLLGKTLVLTGEVRLGVAAAAARGTLLVDPLLGRRLVYDLEWRDSGGHPHRFHGQKDVTARHPVESLTVLRGTVYRRGVPMGTATLRFALRDLPAFAWSMARSQLPIA